MIQNVLIFMLFLALEMKIFIFEIIADKKHTMFQKLKINARDVQRERALHRVK